MWRCGAERERGEERGRHQPAGEEGDDKTPSSQHSESSLQHHHCHNSPSPHTSPSLSPVNILLLLLLLYTPTKNRVILVTSSKCDYFSSFCLSVLRVILEISILISFFSLLLSIFLSVSFLVTSDHWSSKHEPPRQMLLVGERATPSLKNSPNRTHLKDKHLSGMTSRSWSHTTINSPTKLDLVIHLSDIHRLYLQRELCCS